MKKYKFSSAALLLLLFLPAISWSQSYQMFYKAAGSPANPGVQASWNKYYTNQGVADLCSKLAKTYPDLVTMETIGKSFQGRDIYLLTITDKKTGIHSQKPGFWIDGNIHSIELQGTEMTLYTAWYLCEMFDENDFIRKLLAEKTFYIAPTINPDGREYFTSSTVPPRSGLAPRDNDRDGLVDEDGTDDLNGDKEISLMRIKSQRGNMKIDPSDPRKMIRVAPDEKGDYELLGYEGFDNDGDGLINEDGPGGYDGNRDWGFNWEPNYVQNGADKYPFSFPENQAVRDFVKNHPNIAASQSFHNSGGMILRGPSIRGGGSEAYSRQDDDVIERIGLTGEKIIPGYKLLTIWKDLYTVWGGELDWMHGNGCFVYSNELWTSYLMFYDSTNTDQYEFDRLLLFDDAFIPWQKAIHPQYGEIEIGGFKKTLGRLHPGFLIETDAHRNAAFCIYNAYEMPLLEVKDITVKNLDGGLKEVSAAIENKRMLPTHSASNLKYRIDPPDYVFLDGGTVLSGMIVDDVLQNRTTEQKKNPGRLEVNNIPGNSQVYVRWIVKGGSKFNVKVESVKGGRASGQSK
ncbi:MAG: peptidase M14 [Bacteroidetes bacterium GWE2_41_25]|nr:MAG: peptidase M14 [Bacteroidetes bacterium GWA2_40_15]OFX89763.1 MAG: peptidase M14 [Bacteroidetes bacterium GWC2_40_22]OFY00681.1 MAG: peptidase M14 [Bacteroidetes bacterium GWE2_41_25]OFY61312.1 MAG: peptidase M14 [Bacteroidetes bacterium GWF2_41_9]HAM11426.1 peptidase M14 [Bacteroidales bacterium]